MTKFMIILVICMSTMLTFADITACKFANGGAKCAGDVCQVDCIAPYVKKVTKQTSSTNAPTCDSKGGFSFKDSVTTCVQSPMDTPPVTDFTTGCKIKNGFAQCDAGSKSCRVQCEKGFASRKITLAGATGASPNNDKAECKDGDSLSAYGTKYTCIAEVPANPPTTKPPGTTGGDKPEDGGKTPANTKPAPCQIQNGVSNCDAKTNYCQVKCDAGFIESDTRARTDMVTTPQCKGGVVTLWEKELKCVPESSYCDVRVCEQQCKIGKCNRNTNKCEFTSAEDGAKCMYMYVQNGVCKNGTCTEPVCKLTAENDIKNCGPILEPGKECSYKDKCPDGFERQIMIQCSGADRMRKREMSCPDPLTPGTKPAPSTTVEIACDLNRRGALSCDEKGAVVTPTGNDLKPLCATVGGLTACTGEAKNGAAFSLSSKGGSSSCTALPVKGLRPLGIAIVAKTADAVVPPSLYIIAILPAGAQLDANAEKIAGWSKVRSPAQDSMIVLRFDAQGKVQSFTFVSSVGKDGTPITPLSVKAFAATPEGDILLGLKIGLSPRNIDGTAMAGCEKDTEFLKHAMNWKLLLAGDLQTAKGSWAQDPCKPLKPEVDLKLKTCGEVEWNAYTGKVQCDKEKCKGTCGQEGCVCKAGYVGDFCERCEDKTQDPKNGCKPATCDRTTCSGHGECKVADTGKEKCTCDKGFQGPACEQKLTVDACANVKCANGASCENGKCKCGDKFSGPTCEIERVPCVKETCSGHGSCLPTDNLLFASIAAFQPCKCDVGWFGPKCEKETTVGCKDGDCQNGGACSKDGSCNCADGFTGPKCQYKPSQFADRCKEKVNCFNGKCVEGDCVCGEGFTGPLCDKKQVDCNAKTCLNGECQKAKDGKSLACVCKTGFTGPNCDKKSDDVASGKVKECDAAKDCNGRGTCEKGEKGVVCFCKSGFSGVSCEVAVCNNDDCSGNGVCKGGKCLCNSGFGGPDCSDKEIECDEDDCSGHGKCGAKGKCECQASWTGPACDKQAAVCDVKAMCSNNAVRCDAGKCVCKKGFEGADCSKQVCNDKQCGGNGVCGSDGGCDCEEGWSGPTCASKLDAIKCDPKVQCSGNGDCNAKGSCNCKDGFHGVKCELELKEQGCSNDTCNNHGVCSAGVNKVLKCACDAGFSGDRCRMCASGAGMYPNCKLPTVVPVEDDEDDAETNIKPGKPVTTQPVVTKLVKGPVITIKVDQPTITVDQAVAAEIFRTEVAEAVDMKKENIVILKTVPLPDTDKANNDTPQILVAFQIVNITADRADVITKTLVTEIEAGAFKFIPEQKAVVVKSAEDLKELIDDLSPPRPVSKCTASFCKNNGKCVMQDGKAPACNCPSGWGGSKCEEKVAETALCDSYCKNDGVCRAKGKIAMCECKEGFNGRQCEIDDPCKKTECGNGKCANSYGKPVCKCAEGFTNDKDGKCSAKIEDVCKDNGPCGKNGKCRAPRGKAVCECSAGFKGDTCAEQGSATIDTQCDRKKALSCIDTVKPPSNPDSPDDKCAMFDSYLKCAKDSNCPNFKTVWCNTLLAKDKQCQQKYCADVVDDKKGDPKCNGAGSAACLEKVKDIKDSCEAKQAYVTCLKGEDGCPDILAGVCSFKVGKTCAAIKGCPDAKPATQITEKMNELLLGIPGFHMNTKQQQQRTTSPLVLTAVLAAICVAVVALLVAVALVARKLRQEKQGTYYVEMNDQFA